MTIGYYDKAKYKGDIHWIPIDFKYMFGVKLEDIRINGKSIGLCKGQENCLITFDSGTSYMAFPDFGSKQLKKMGYPTESDPVKCNSEKEFGEMVLVIGGKEYKLSNEEWMQPAQNITQVSSVQLKKRKTGALGP